jgi:5'-3' exoribonuclease 1
MTEETSPIYDFYPRQFELDMNGKKQDWEAVVKIPFIDQKRLLKAMARELFPSHFSRIQLMIARDQRLTDEEKRRNQSGVLSTQFTYDENCDEHYPSSQPGFFPDLAHSRARASPFNLPTLGNGVDLILGLIQGVSIGAGALAGFPSLHTLPHNGALGYHGVNVFQTDSRNQSMVITITSTKGERGTTESIASQHIGKRVFTTWPYLHEGMVVAVSDDMFKYEKANFGKSNKVVANPHNPYQQIAWKKQADGIEHHYSKRFGVICGNVDRVLHVRPLKGMSSILFLLL